MGCERGNATVDGTARLTTHAYSDHLFFSSSAYSASCPLQRLRRAREWRPAPSLAPPATTSSSWWHVDSSRDGGAHSFDHFLSGLAKAKCEGFKVFHLIFPLQHSSAPVLLPPGSSPTLAPVSQERFSPYSGRSATAAGPIPPKPGRPPTQHLSQARTRRELGPKPTPSAPHPLIKPSIEPSPSIEPYPSPCRAHSPRHHPLT